MKLLIAIDVQVDFHDVPEASLPVTNSQKDTERICKLVNNLNYDAIIASMDSHLPNDISHPNWWNDHKGNPVGVFTMITADDVLNGKYIPRIDPKRSLKYIQDLEANGEFLHTIWPEHCIIGSKGQSLMPNFLETINNWSRKRLGWVNIIDKGKNPFTEHFGIFRANVPMMEDPNTQVNQGLFQHLNVFKEFHIVGQAKSHCVVNSLKQLLEIAPLLADKIVVIEDCMSDVLGLPQEFYENVDKIYTNAKNQGVKFVKSTDL